MATTLYQLKTKAKITVFAKANSSSNTLRQISKNKIITGTKSGNWYKLTDGGYIMNSSVEVISSGSTGIIGGAISGTVSSITTVTANYKVNMSSIWTYDSPNGTRISRLMKDAVVQVKYTTNTLSPTAASEIPDWFQISKLISGEAMGSVEGKYIQNNSSIIKQKASSSSVKKDSKDSNSNNDNPTVEETTVNSYGTYLTSEQYQNNIKDGLRITDLRGIFGLPHQFLPNTDPRIDGTMEPDSFGIKYAEKIISPMPLLLMTPGTPEFMSSYNTKQRNLMLENYFGKLQQGELDALVNTKNGKFYSLRYDYTNYFYYVNAMLRAAAYFLGIQDVEINNRKLGTFNWLYDNMNRKSNSDIFGNEGLFKYLGTYAGCIPFYVDSETSINDNFSNSTTNPSVADSINGLSDQAREMNFLMGTVSGAAGGALDGIAGINEETGLNGALEDISENLIGGNNILSNITDHAASILSGGKMLFPEIWSSSDFSRDYDIKIKLVSPSGDKLSVFLNILVPIYHLLCFVLPRQSASQAYYSPFLVRAFYKGLFNVDMGIITSFSVTKGAEGEWTVDGLPTVAEVSFTIKDLYNGMFMSSAMDFNDLNIMSNITELDYIANSCGININEPDVIRTVQMYLALDFTGRAKDAIEIGIFGEFTQWCNQKIQNIFGKFNN